jgi:hypothetical protein
VATKDSRLEELLGLLVEKAINPKKSTYYLKPPGKLRLEFSDAKGEGYTLLDQANMWLRKYRDWARSSNMDINEPEYVAHLASSLEGRASFKYYNHLASRKIRDRHLPLEQFEAFLRDIAQQTTDPMYEMMDSLLGYSITSRIAAGLSIDAVFDEVDVKFTKLAQEFDVPDWLRIFIVARACPSAIRHKALYDSEKTTRPDGKRGFVLHANYQAQRDTLVGMHAALLDACRDNRSPPSKRNNDTYAKVVEVDKKPRYEEEEKREHVRVKQTHHEQPRERARDPPRQSSIGQRQQTTRGFKAYKHVPLASRHAEGGRGYHVEIVGISPDVLADRFKNGRCTICDNEEVVQDKPRHIASECPRRHKMFKDGLVFFYDKAYKFKPLPPHDYA